MEKTSHEEMSDMSDVRCRLEASVLGLLLGHQMGQWSERKWWRFPQNGRYETEIALENFDNDEWLHSVIVEPSVITTPGWGPTGYGNLIPYVCALGMEYIKQQGPLTPELFRDFLLREREWLRPQAVGRTCVELMAEGMNPRIAGLYAPSVITASWIAWPVAIYNVGYPEEAYEDAVLLARSQTSGNGVVVTGLIAAMLACVMVPNASWEDVREVLLLMAEKRQQRIAVLIEAALQMGRNTNNAADWITSIKAPEYSKKTSAYLDWLTDFYVVVCAMEYANVQQVGWRQLMKPVLEATDSRFGAMILMSLRTALLGKGMLPTQWVLKTKELHSGRLRSLVTGSIDLLGKKLEEEISTARQMLSVVDGENGHSLLYDRILAAFLAGAIGNTMGSPVEDRDYPWIEEKYGIVDFIIAPERLKSEDDSAMAKMWANTYIQCKGRARVEDLAKVFRRDLIRADYYYDVQHSYDLVMQGLPPHVCGHWNIVTGSAMMGCYPCGMFHAGRSDLAAVDAIELSYSFQRGFDVFGAGIISAAVAEALHPTATVDSVLDAAVNAAPMYPMQYFDRHQPRDVRSHLKSALDSLEGCDDVLKGRAILYEGYLEYNGQDPWEVVTFALGIFKVANGDVWQCMLGGTNIGRDSDTIASLSSTLAACLHGTGSIPKHLLLLFDERALQEYEEIAQHMVELVSSRCKRSLNVARRLGYMR